MTTNTTLRDNTDEAQLAGPPPQHFIEHKNGPVDPLDGPKSVRIVEIEASWSGLADY